MLQLVRLCRNKTSAFCKTVDNTIFFQIGALLLLVIGLAIAAFSFIVGFLCLIVRFVCSTLKTCRRVSTPSAEIIHAQSPVHKDGDRAERETMVRDNGESRDNGVLRVRSSNRHLGLSRHHFRSTLVNKTSSRKG